METLSVVVILAGLLLTVLNIFNVSIILKDKAKEPAKEMREEIESLKREVELLKRSRSEEARRTTELEEANKVLLQGVSALLTHGINGNNIEEMKDARDKLNKVIYD